MRGSVNWLKWNSIGLFKLGNTLFLCFWVYIIMKHIFHEEFHFVLNDEGVENQMTQTKDYTQRTLFNCVHKSVGRCLQHYSHPCSKFWLFRNDFHCPQNIALLVIRMSGRLLAKIAIWRSNYNLRHIYQFGESVRTFIHLHLF